MKQPHEINILIGCEESQAVCKAFRALGFNAFSCDIQECSGGHPEWHIQGDVFDAIKLKDWDFIGLHPVCTKMALSGNRHYARGKLKHHERMDAVAWTINLWLTAKQKAKCVYMENPLGAMNGNTNLPKPQIVHPYYFGDEAQKATCFWTKGLPELLHYKEDTLLHKKTHVSRGEMVTFKSGKTMPKWYADTPSTKSEANRAIRSKTFPGIAAAMADQWGKYLLENL